MKLTSTRKTTTKTTTTETEHYSAADTAELLNDALYEHGPSADKKATVALAFAVLALTAELRKQQK